MPLRNLVTIRWLRLRGGLASLARGFVTGSVVSGRVMLFKPVTTVGLQCGVKISFSYVFGEQQTLPLDCISLLLMLWVLLGWLERCVCSVSMSLKSAMMRGTETTRKC